MLTGARDVKDAKKGNYIIVIALKRTNFPLW